MSYLPPPLSAIDQVRQAKARYCRYLDTKQWDAFADLFISSPDISVYGAAEELIVSFSSRDMFVSVAREYLAGAQSIHQVHNDELTQLSERDISAIWSMEDYIVFPNTADERPSRHHGYGHYHENWVLTADGWRIASLKLRRTILEITP
jgi:3-phenylpropionate/cinnamic acid dioxygenase small subunit